MPKNNTNELAKNRKAIGMHQNKNSDANQKYLTNVNNYTNDMTDYPFHININQMEVVTNADMNSYTTELAYTIGVAIYNISQGKNIGKNLALMTLACSIFYPNLLPSLVHVAMAQDSNPNNANNNIMHVDDYREAIELIETHACDSVKEHNNESSQKNVAKSLDTLPAGPTYKDHPTKLIAKEDIACEKKTGRNKGKKCTLFNDDYLMKEVAKNEAEERVALTQAPNVPQKSNPFRSMYFFKFIENISSEIKKPELTLFYETNKKSPKGKFYYGSKYIEDFIPASAITDRLFDIGLEEFEIIPMLRTELEQRIGKHNIPVLMVVSTFIYDLANNWDNWGYDKKGNLVFIDVDYPLYTLNMFYEIALNAIKTYTNRGVYLSINDIKAMKKIYLEMKDKSLPSVHESVNLSQDSYDLLLDIYIKACDKTIEGNKTILRAESSISINHALQLNIEQESKPHHKVAKAIEATKYKK